MRPMKGDDAWRFKEAKNKSGWSGKSSWNKRFEVWAVKVEQETGLEHNPLLSL